MATKKKPPRPSRTVRTRLPTRSSSREVTGVVDVDRDLGQGRAGKKSGKKPSVSEVTEARVQALAKVFAALGARNAETWARTHVDDGSDELGRFVLLRAMWLRSIEPGRLLANARKDRTAGPAVERLMKNASITDLDALIRFAQRSSLDDVCKVLDDPADNDDGIRWAVFRVDAKGLPLWTLDRLRTGLDDSEP
jgi:hypothetical protein